MLCLREQTGTITGAAEAVVVGVVIAVVIGGNPNPIEQHTLRNCLYPQKQ